MCGFGSLRFVILSIISSRAAALTTGALRSVSLPSFCENVNTHCCNPWLPVALMGRENPEPRMIWSHACAGSSTVLDWTHGLMELSDSPSLDCTRGYEVLADFQNGYYPGVMDTRWGIAEFIRSSAQARRAFLFKAELHNVQDHPNVQSYLTEMRPRTVFLKRWNVLDTLICSIRDCFVGMALEPGFTTDNNGTESECFRGRTHEEMESPQVYLNPLTVLENINILGSYNDDSYNYLTRLGVADVPPVIFTSEELFAFEEEYPGKENESVSAWGRLLTALDVDLDREVIRTFLQERRLRLPPRPHRQVISNFWEIQTIIENCPYVDPGVEALAYRTEEWCARVKSMLRY
eukprot:TRINITY_DN67059_c0_g1_i1.p1 TRINITY_DN67059_c0_g1~~TRINITY_DN67059_c0_g1_i1.p1  ORF type:complete len:349 (+),score=34.95 TRINITY_DN67059_c0_g1_i1:80-1126(+)